VYDLQSEFEGLYTANGILVHNCRCSWIPKLKSYQDLLAPYIAKIKSMPGKIDPEAMLQPTEYGNMKPVSIEPFQEWALKNLSPDEMGDN
jgi:hypothetical protein